MDITIKIPNGIMHIHAEPFFAEAGRGKVRRILKLLRDTWPSQAQTEELKNWLREQIQTEEDRQKQEASAYETLVELECREYCWRHMQNIKRAQKREERYRASLEDVVRILEGG